MSTPHNTGSSPADYAHWNEEAPIIKAQEDRGTDYYRGEPDYNGDDYRDYE
jgi:hypothetical protein